jgi:endonuclease/exonuclease/phosphatase (EEP) superfamily protein YafD
MKIKIKNLFVIFLVIFIFGCGYVPVRIPFILSGNYYQKQSIREDRLRILSWNIHKEVNDINWENDFIKIVRDNKNPNIILLQEVRLEKNIIEILKDDLEMGWEFAPNLYQEKYGAYSGVLTASSIKPTMVKPALSNGTEPFTKTRKPVLFTKYNLGLASFELLVVNIHGIDFKIDLDEFKDQISYVAGAVMEHDGPVIMAGDFNTWSEDRLKHLYKIVKELELVKIKFGSKSDYVKTIFGNPLDHIFISKEKLEVVKGSQDVILDIKSSDHYPLFVELRIRQ